MVLSKSKKGRTKQMKFVLNLQLFASKKGVGSTKNGRDSAGRRLGAKAGDGEFVTAGSILYRQRGTKVSPGANVMKGGDDTLFTTIDGPVKFERIAQWEMPTTVTATGNSFDISAQTDDAAEGKTKNVGLYFGANAKFDLVADKNEKLGNTAALYTAVYSAPGNKTYAGLPAGSTVKDSRGNDTKLTDALEWKGTTQLTLETKYVAKIGDTEYTTLEAAFAALNADNHTLTLLDENAWTYENVYWKAGTKSGSATTPKAALAAAYAEDAESITIICKPNATIAKSNPHIDVTGDITVYANGANFGGDDLSIGAYKAPKNSTTRPLV